MKDCRVLKCNLHFGSFFWFDCDWRTYSGSQLVHELFSEHSNVILGPGAHYTHPTSAILSWPIIRPSANTKICLLLKNNIFLLIFKIVLLQQGCLYRLAFMLSDKFLLHRNTNVRIKQFSCKQISTLDRFQLIWTQLRNIRFCLMCRMMRHS